MSRAAKVARRARRAAESIMDDACRVWRNVGNPVTDPDTGEVSREPVDVYVGKCRVRPLSSVAAEAPAGGVMATQLPMIVSLPVGDEQFAFDDWVQITTSGDPGMAGRLMRVRSIQEGTHLSARRLTCDVETEARTAP